MLIPGMLDRDRGRPTARGYILAAWVRSEGTNAAEAEGDDKEKTIEDQADRGCRARLTPRSPAASMRFT